MGQSGLQSSGLQSSGLQSVGFKVGLEWNSIPNKGITVVGLEWSIIPSIGVVNLDNWI